MGVFIFNMSKAYNTEGISRGINHSARSKIKLEEKKLMMLTLCATNIFSELDFRGMKKKK